MSIVHARPPAGNAIRYGILNMAVDIPFEVQHDSTLNRMCGAACLSMIYKYYGISDNQDKIWQRIAQPDTYGNLFSRAFKICADLIFHDIHAVIIKARNPLKVLNICNLNNYTAILCHRINKKSNVGHFTVFEKLKGEYVFVNDPVQGKDRRISKKTILKLWQPTDGIEVVGNLLITISNNGDDINLCSKCNQGIPTSIICPYCIPERLVPLKPNRTIGCINDKCSQKTWEFIVCPFCDRRIESIP